LPFVQDSELRKNLIEKGTSYWRTLFVANEYNELSTIRIISIEFCLFGLGLLM